MSTEYNHNSDNMKDGEYIYKGGHYANDGSLIGPSPISNNDNKLDYQKLMEEIDAIEQNLDRDNSSTPTPILWEEIEKMTFPEDRWRIRNILPKEGFTILASVSGERKTWLALEMAKCIALGKNFLDNSDFETKEGNVLYLDMEMSASELQRRGKQLSLGEQKEKLFIVNNNDLNLNTEDGANWLIEMIEQYKISTVFIDTFRAVAGGLKEEKAEEIRTMFNRFKLLKNKEVSVIFLDHLRKPNNFEGKIVKKEHLFGSQDKSASVEILLMMKSGDNGEIEIYQRKNRLGPEIRPFKVLMKDTEENGQIKTFLTFDGEIEPQETKKEEAKEFILSILNDGSKTTKELRQIIFNEAKIGEKNIRAALSELVDEKKIDFKRNGRENCYYLFRESENLQEGIL